MAKNIEKETEEAIKKIEKLLTPKQWEDLNKKFKELEEKTNIELDFFRHNNKNI